MQIWSNEVAVRQAKSHAYGRLPRTMQIDNSPNLRVCRENTIRRIRSPRGFANSFLLASTKWMSVGLRDGTLWVVNQTPQGYYRRVDVKTGS